jgi:hypothetical protein
MYLVAILKLKDQCRIKFMYIPEYRVLQSLKTDVLAVQNNITPQHKNPYSYFIHAFKDIIPIFNENDKLIEINKINNKFTEFLKYDVQEIALFNYYTWDELLLASI